MCCSYSIAFSIVVISSGRNSEIVVCYIDLRKAYDSVQFDMMNYKIQKLGIHGRFQQIVAAILQPSSLRIKLDQFLTDEIKSSCGLPQGDSISPTLFGVFINDLTQYIRDSVPADTHLGCDHLMYADDILLISRSPEKLQVLVETVHTYCQQWGLTINKSKSKVQLFSKVGSKEPQIMLEGQILEVVSSYLYLGVTFSSLDQCKDIYETHKKLVLKQSLHKIYRIISVTRFIPTEEALECFNTMARCHMEYASAVCSYTRKEWIEAEGLQLLFARKLLGVNPKATTAAVRGELGLMTMQSRFDLLQINYWIHTRTLPESSLIRHAIIMEADAVKEQSFSHHVKQLFTKYGVDATMSKDKIKQMIKVHEVTQWHKQRSDQTKLRTYSRIKFNLEFEDYLKFGTEDKLEHMIGRRHLTKLRIGTNRLKIETGRYHKPLLIPVEQRLCLNCDAHAVEDEWHVLLDCQAFTSHREQFKRRTSNVTHNQVDISTMTIPEKQMYFLGNFPKRCRHNKYLWDQIKELKQFIHDLMQHHQHLDAQRSSR